MPWWLNFLIIEYYLNYGNVILTQYVQNNNLKYMDDSWPAIIVIFVIDLCGFLFYSTTFLTMVTTKKISTLVIKNKKWNMIFARYIYMCMSVSSFPNSDSIQESWPQGWRCRLCVWKRWPSKGRVGLVS